MWACGVGAVVVCVCACGVGVVVTLWPSVGMFSCASPTLIYLTQRVRQYDTLCERVRERSQRNVHTAVLSPIKCDNAQLQGVSCVYPVS